MALAPLPPQSLCRKPSRLQADPFAKRPLSWPNSGNRTIVYQLLALPQGSFDVDPLVGPWARLVPAVAVAVVGNVDNAPALGKRILRLVSSSSPAQAVATERL